jgi:hypothetical protein
MVSRSYLSVRVGGQIDDHYRPRAHDIKRSLRVVRRVEVTLAVFGALLAAAAGTWEQDAIAIWMPVLTTIGAAVAAHAAAER